MATSELKKKLAIDFPAYGNIGASHIRYAAASVPSQVRMRSTTRRFAQCYLILGHFQHSKFNIRQKYRIPLLTIGTLHCLCVCIVVQLHALRAQQNKHFLSVYFS